MFEDDQDILVLFLNCIITISLAVICCLPQRIWRSTCRGDNQFVSVSCSFQIHNPCLRKKYSHLEKMNACTFFEKRAFSAQSQYALI